MKYLIALLFFFAASLTTYGQCSFVAVQISASDTTLVQLYNAGFFLIPSGIDNVCEWEVTTFDGEVVHQATTSGGFNEQSTTLFNHSVPITDSMKVSLLITNNTEGITCLMQDTLLWEETEILPGSFIGDWVVLSSNGGVEEPIISSTNYLAAEPAIELYPNPATNLMQLVGPQAFYTIALFDLSGQLLRNYPKIPSGQSVDLSSYAPGMYLVQIRDIHGQYLGVRKLIKQ